MMFLGSRMAIPESPKAYAERHIVIWFRHCWPRHIVIPFRHFNFPRLRRDTIPMREEYLKMNTFLSENSDRKISDRNSFFNRQTFQDAENKLITWSLLAGMSFLLYGILYTI